MRRTAVLACALAWSARAATDVSATKLRHDSYLVFRATAGESVSIVVESVAKAQYTYRDAPRVIVLDPASRRVLDTGLRLGETRSIRYEPRSSGLHAVCIQAGQNLVNAHVAGRPWAIVARTEAPVHICGQPGSWYFTPPAGVDTVVVFVHAPVKGEAAGIRLVDGAGKVVDSREEDFDAVTCIKAAIGEGVAVKPWRLDILDPGRTAFGLDDVSVWLGSEMQPLLCLDPTWLQAFAGVMGEAPEQIARTVTVADTLLRLTASSPQTLCFDLPAIPASRLVALRVKATDIDYRREASVSLNGAELFLPVTGDGLTAEVTVKLAREWLKVGENTLELSQDACGGSRVYTVSRIELLFGDAVNFD